jgi:hypothetical protein
VLLIDRDGSGVGNLELLVTFNDIAAAQLTKFSLGFTPAGPIATAGTNAAESLAGTGGNDELLGLAGDEVDVQIALTRAWPTGWSGHRGRIDRALIDDTAWPPQQRPRIYVCGPTGFVEAAAELLVEGGHPPHSIRTERFGPTGG